MLVTEGADPVFWRSYRASGVPIESGHPAAGGTRWESPEPLSERGGYTLSVRLDGRTEWKSTDFSNVGDCVHVELPLDGRSGLRIYDVDCDQSFGSRTPRNRSSAGSISNPSES